MTPAPGKHTFVFPSSEKLKHKTRIDELFSKGSSFFIYPFKCWFFLPEASAQPPVILTGVPKKTFKKAVDRNRFKRCIREIYRLNHRSEAMQYAPGYCLGIIYVGKEKLSYKEMEKKLNSVFNRYIEDIKKSRI